MYINVNVILITKYKKSNHKESILLEYCHFRMVFIQKISIKPGQKCLETVLKSVWEQSHKRVSGNCLD